MPSKRPRVALVFLLLMSVVFVAPVLGQDTGSADFSSYVSIGDSLTAGLSNGGVSVSWQSFSYGALVHAQSGAQGPYAQPLFSDPGIPNQLELIGLDPVTIQPAPGTAIPLNLTYPAPYNNLGIPGANVSDLLSTICGFPFYDLILRNASCLPPTSSRAALPDSTVVQQALALQPTFVSVWAGNNDALQAATSGGLVPPTDLSSFSADYGSMMAALAASGAQFALINVPDVTTIPFATTVPPFVVDPATGDPLLIAGAPVPLIAETSSGVRPLTGDDLVLLTALPEISQGVGVPPPLGSGTPLPSAFVLDVDEKRNLRRALRDYNDVIRREAASAGAALVDIHAALKEVGRNGLVLGGVAYSSEFLTGGLFGYDGIHPSRLGYALVANEVIASINRTYGAQIPAVDLLPFVFGPLGTGAAALPGTRGERAVFTRAAADSVFQGLGLPTLDRLLGERPSSRPSSRHERIRAGADGERGAGRLGRR